MLTGQVTWPLTKAEHNSSPWGFVLKRAKNKLNSPVSNINLHDSDDPVDEHKLGRGLDHEEPDQQDGWDDRHGADKPQQHSDQAGKPDKHVDCTRHHQWSLELWGEYRFLKVQYVGLQAWENTAF